MTGGVDFLKTDQFNGMLADLSQKINTDRGAMDLPALCRVEDNVVSITTNSSQGYIVSTASDQNDFNTRNFAARQVIVACGPGLKSSSLESVKVKINGNLRAAAEIRRISRRGGLHFEPARQPSELFSSTAARPRPRGRPRTPTLRARCDRLGVPGRGRRRSRPRAIPSAATRRSSQRPRAGAGSSRIKSPRLRSMPTGRSFEAGWRSNSKRASKTATRW